MQVLFQNDMLIALLNGFWCACLAAFILLLVTHVLHLSVERISNQR